MCSNDVLKERIDNLTSLMKTFHDDFKDVTSIERSEHQKIFKRIDDLDKKYVTRREFNMVKFVGWALLTLVASVTSVIALFNK